MRGFAILFVVACVAAASQAAGFTDEQKSKLMEHYKKCTESTGVDKLLIEKARKGEFSKDDKLARYYYCMFLESGIVNEAGDVQMDVIKSKLPPDVKQEDAEKVIAACKNIKGKDKFEKSQLIFECYYNTSPTHLTFA